LCWAASGDMWKSKIGGVQSASVHARAWVTAWMRLLGAGGQNVVVIVRLVSTVVHKVSGHRSACVLGGAGRLGSIVLVLTGFWISVALTLTMQESVHMSLVVVVG
jgi:hypothetical protein